MEIPKAIKDEIWDYCRVNNISNIDDFTIKLLKQGFTVEKFGATPSTTIVEKIVEKEVPVEKIVEKEVLISNDAELKILTDKVKSLTKEGKDCVANNLLIQQELDDTKKALANEKQKNNRDIYGEN